MVASIVITPSENRSTSLCRISQLPYLPLPAPPVSISSFVQNRHFDVLSKECQEHRERLRGVIQGIADQVRFLRVRLENCDDLLILLRKLGGVPG